MNLLNVRPAFAPDDLANFLKTDAEHFGNLLVGFSFRVELANLVNVIRCKFGVLRCLTLRWVVALSAFADHILDILDLSTKKQMIWIDTGAIVAFVKNTKAIRNFSIGNGPGNPVCGTNFSLKHQSAVSKAAPESLPFPTLGGVPNIYFRPEAGMFGKIVHAGNLLSRLFATLPDVQPSREQLDSDYTMQVGEVCYLVQ